MMDRFTPDYNKYDEMYCKVCHTKMLVQRGIEDYRTYNSALAGMKEKFDIFECPHREKDWHKTAKKLIIEIEKTPSKSLRQIYQSDLNDLLENLGGECV